MRDGIFWPYSQVCKAFVDAEWEDVAFMCSDLLFAADMTRSFTLEVLGEKTFVNLLDTQSQNEKSFIRFFWYLCNINPKSDYGDQVVLIF
jgi:hypothetical protein